MANTEDIISLTELFKPSKTGVKIKKQKKIIINQFRCVLIDTLINKVSAPISIDPDH